jgi:hypothetical protein
MKKEINAHEYLNNMLTTWTRFCKEHPLMIGAIESLLNENKLLEAELKKYKQ